MTLTADHPARANSVGDPCPPWCTISHGTDDTDIHKSAEAEISLDHSPHYGYLTARALQVDAGDEPYVSVHARSHVVADPAVIVQSVQWMPAADALKLADLIDVLAHATPEQHRELSAAIRQAAAAITETAGA